MLCFSPLSLDAVVLQIQDKIDPLLSCENSTFPEFHQSTPVWYSIVCMLHIKIIVVEHVKDTFIEVNMLIKYKISCGVGVEIPTSQRVYDILWYACYISK